MAKPLFCLKMHMSDNVNVQFSNESETYNIKELSPEFIFNIEEHIIKSNDTIANKGENRETHTMNGQIIGVIDPQSSQYEQLPKPISIELETPDLNNLGIANTPHNMNILESITLAQLSNELQTKFGISENTNTLGQNLADAISELDDFQDSQTL